MNDAKVSKSNELRAQASAALTEYLKSDSDAAADAAVEALTKLIRESRRLDALRRMRAQATPFPRKEASA